jgi:alginate O-acetyltransferase complex protein AlgJ
MARRSNITFTLVFAAVLLAPTFASVCHWDPMGGIDEKRKLAERPTAWPWSLNGMHHVSEMTQDWEKYFNDHFGLRKLLIGSYRLMTYYLLRTSPDPSVVLGEWDGERRWLYLEPSINRDGIGFESSLGQKPYRPAELHAIADQLKRVTALVNAKHATLAIIVCPDKQTIYPEYLPPRLRPPPGAVSRLDQFWIMAAGLEGIPLIDMRLPLWQAKSSMQVYYPSDTHWNWRAGILAYQAIADVLSRQDGARALSRFEGLQGALSPRRAGDLIYLMGIPAIGGDLDWQPKFPETGPKHGKLLVVGDSFFTFLAPFLERQFAEVKLIRASMRVRTLLTPELLDAEKPDAVILESVERFWTM